MEHIWTIVVTALASVIASSGFWAYLQSRDKQKSATNRMLMGLSYDKITFLGGKYIERGWVSRDEYEDLVKYFYEPYKELGGNGVAERVMEEVRRLPLGSYRYYSDVIKTDKEIVDD